MVIKRGFESKGTFYEVSLPYLKNKTEQFTQ